MGSGHCIILTSTKDNEEKVSKKDKNGRIKVI
jgi:hypothetical protein